MISITDLAASKVKSSLEKRGKGIGIRIGVRTTGCSGMAYVLEYVDESSKEDQCIESNGCKLFVDPKSLAYISGLSIDWVKNGLNEGFDFKNPNEKDRCGCGESFRI
jgi:iron-sulfur cluster assembly protein